MLARLLREAEDASNDALMKTARITVEMPAASARAGLSMYMDRHCIKKATIATVKAEEYREAMLDLHDACAEYQVRAGLRDVAFGDWGEKTTPLRPIKGEAEPIRRVA